MLLVRQLSGSPIVWFKDFVGVGYRYHDVYMNVFPLFQDKMFAFKLWKSRGSVSMRKSFPSQTKKPRSSTGSTEGMNVTLKQLKSCSRLEL